MMNWSGRRKDAMSDLAGEFDRFHDDFDALRTKLVRLAGETAKDLNVTPHKLAELKSVLDDRLAMIEDEMGDLGRQLRARGGAAADRVERRVHEQPFAALAIAAGVGFVAAHLLRRRHRHHD